MNRAPYAVGKLEAFLLQKVSVGVSSGGGGRRVCMLILVSD